MRSNEEIERAIKTCDDVITMYSDVIFKKPKEEQGDEEEQRMMAETHYRFVARRNVLRWILDDTKEDWI